MRSDPPGELRLLIAAFQVLTRVPMPAVPWAPDTLRRAARYFPLVGVAVGACSGAILLSARHVWPDAIAATLCVACTLLLTGALHEDGLADTADSLGGTDRASRLAIMKDSRVGSYGVCALTVALAARIAALAALPPAAALPAIVAAAGGGRFACVLAMRLMPYAGDASVAKLDHGRDRPGAGEVGVAAVFGLLPFALVEPGRALPALFCGVALAAPIAWRIGRALGGHTGDLLGAIEVAFETGALIGAARLVPA